MDGPWKDFLKEPTIRNRPHAGTGEESLIIPTPAAGGVGEQAQQEAADGPRLYRDFCFGPPHPSGWGRWVNEPVWYIIDGFSVAFIGLSLVNLYLLRKNVKSRAFYFGNTIYQLFPSVLLGGLLPFLFLPLVVLNVVILVTLRGRMPAEQGTTSQTQAGTSAPS